jgi:hypothetical protein
MAARLLDIVYTPLGYLSFLHSIAGYKFRLVPFSRSHALLHLAIAVIPPSTFHHGLTAVKNRLL